MTIAQEYIQALTEKGIETKVESNRFAFTIGTMEYWFNIFNKSSISPSHTVDLETKETKTGKFYQARMYSTLEIVSGHLYRRQQQEVL